MQFIGHIAVGDELGFKVKIDVAVLRHRPPWDHYERINRLFLSTNKIVAHAQYVDNQFWDTKLVQKAEDRAQLWEACSSGGYGNLIERPFDLARHLVGIS